MLLSPEFLFRSETHAAGIRDLDGYELASRLSYFLWSSMPDDELFALAESGELANEDVLRDQVDRMLDDDRSDSLLEEFAARWLDVDEEHIGTIEPSWDQFPEFDTAVRSAMTEETRLFIRHVIREGMPLSTLLTANFTFLNERLASHYGIGGVTGEEMRLVNLSDEQRGGLLRQGSVLMTTSHPDRTSPVLRGKFVLARLLCAPPADPPDNVDALSDEMEDPDTGETLTLRERLERHRADPDCAICHDLMDPIGFSLENYDATGAWRETDNGEEIDSFGILPDGRTLSGAAELGSIIAEDERFAQCVTEKLMTFGIGRSPQTPSDYCYVKDVVERAQDLGPELTLRGLIESLVLNDVFRTVGSLEGGE
jgi:hypothetical protein